MTDIPAKAGHVHFEDQLGNRIADVRVENGAKRTMTLPSSRVVYVRSRLGEAEVSKPRAGVGGIPETSSWTGTLLGAPALGASYQVGNRVAVGAEGVLNVLGFRRLDDRTVTVSLLPTAYAGVTRDP